MRSTVSLLALLIICVATAYACTTHLSLSRIANDGLQNYQAAYNLLNKGTFSTSPTGSPTMDREPLPPVVLAAWLYANDLAETQPQKMNKVNGILRVKSFNILWVILSVCGAYVGVVLLTGSVIGALVGAAVTGWSLSSWGHGLNTMYTEPQTAALLIGLSCISFQVVRKKSWPWAVSLGAGLGLLALTKALALQIAVLALPLFGLLIWMHGSSIVTSLRIILIIAISFASVLGPWIIRNAILFDEPSIAQRAGRVLYYRSMLNEMPAETYRAAFYVWSPPPLKQILEHLAGFTPSDEEKGGAGQWLNRSNKTSFYETDRQADKEARPEIASTYIWKMRAEFRKLRNEFEAENHPDPIAAAFSVMQKEAWKRISANPGNHILAMVPLAWRGIWVSTAPTWMAPFLTLSFLAAWPLLLFRREWSGLAFLLIPSILWASYLTFTHNLPRYVEPLTPVMIVCATMLAVRMLRVSSTRLSAMSPSAGK